MKIRKCVGAIVYDDQGRILLLKSPNWESYIVPGGGMKQGETEEQTLRREVKEEVGIEICDLVKVHERVGSPDSEYVNKRTGFHFISFFAKALHTNVTPSEDVSEYDWFSVDEALKLPLAGKLKELVKQFKKYKKDVK